MSAIISGNYVTFKHIKTRKVVVLEVEVAEEYFQEVITKLGMPIGGESKAVAVALLSSQPTGHDLSPVEQTEGDKLRTRAVLLCKDKDFQQWIYYNTKGSHESQYWDSTEEMTIAIVREQCNIKSRSELATDIIAQNKFKELLEQYKNWQFENNYQDNLTRY